MEGIVQKDSKLSLKNNWHFTKLLHTTTESPVWPHLKPTSKIVYFNLVKHYNFNYKISYPTNKAIMKEEGLSSATLESAFKELNSCFLVIRKNFLNLDKDPFLSDFEGTFFKNDKNYFYLPDFLLHDLAEEIQNTHKNKKFSFPYSSVNILIDSIKEVGCFKIKHRYLKSEYQCLTFDEECLILPQTGVQNLHLNYTIKQYNKLIENLAQIKNLQENSNQTPINITHIHGDQVNVYKGDYQKKLSTYNLKLGNNQKLNDTEIDNLLPQINKDVDFTEEERESVKIGLRTGLIGWAAAAKKEPRFSRVNSRIGTG